MDSGPSAATGQISPHCQSQFRDSTQHLNRALCLPDNVGFVVTSDTGLQGTETSVSPSRLSKGQRKACSQHLPAPWQSAFLPEVGASGFQLLICEKSSTAEAAQPNIKVMNPPQQKYEVLALHRAVAWLKEAATFHSLFQTSAKDPCPF